MMDPEETGSLFLSFVYRCLIPKADNELLPGPIPLSFGGRDARPLHKLCGHWTAARLWIEIGTSTCASFADGQ
jgi:hypothetical protein